MGSNEIGRTLFGFEELPVLGIHTTRASFQSWGKTPVPKHKSSKAINISGTERRANLSNFTGMFLKPDDLCTSIGLSCSSVRRLEIQETSVQVCSGESFLS